MCSATAGNTPAYSSLSATVRWRIAKAALERGLYLMTHWNVVMVCPPLTITREELEEGLAILDDVLAIADEHYTG